MVTTLNIDKCNMLSIGLRDANDGWMDGWNVSVIM